MNKKMSDVLKILDQEDNPSQREIAKKGLLKIEKLNSRNIRYILTPEGIKEKTKKTIDYVKRSYRAIQQMQNQVQEIAEKHRKQGKEIWILKKETDEVLELVVNTLREIKIDFKMIDSLENIEEEKNKDNNIVVYHWDPDLQVENKEIEVINIFA
jgi:rubrerythrin